MLLKQFVDEWQRVFCGPFTFFSLATTTREHIHRTKLIRKDERNSFLSHATQYLSIQPMNIRSWKKAFPISRHSYVGDSRPVFTDDNI